MSDIWNVSASYDKSSYNQGEMMTVHLSGGDVMIKPKGKSGKTTSVPQSVAITGVADSSGRTWIIASGGSSVMTTA